MASAALFGTLAGAGTAAEAADKIVMVLQPKLEGTLSTDEQARFDEAISAALREQQLQLISSKERDTVLAGEGAQGCYSEECQERVGRILDAKAVLSYKLKINRPEGPPPEPKKTKKGGKAAEAEPAPAGATNIGWTMSVMFYNIDVGAVGARSNADCSSCSVVQAAQALGDLVRKVVVEDAARPRGTLEITSEPNNSVVFVDGHELGVTPYRRQAFSGRHEVTLRRQGFRSKVETVNIIDAQKTSLTLKLEEGKDPQPIYIVEPAHRPVWRIAVGAVLMAAGAGVVALGGSALSIDGKPALDAMGNPDPKRVYQSQGPGIGMVVGGLAVMTVGAVIIALPPEKKKPAMQKQVAMGLFGDAGLQVSGTF